MRVVDVMSRIDGVKDVRLYESDSVCLQVVVERAGQFEELYG